MPPEWRGTRFAEPGGFPILVKFIFPKDKLSIQVHPDDAYAAVHEQAAGGRGKTEMWHVVSAEPGAKVLVGLKPGVTKQNFLESLSANTLEELFVAHAVHSGDTFFVPAGTPHTIGPGMVLCEVQEYSDLTYRVYDYGRFDSKGKARELHIEKALAVIGFGQSPSVKVEPHDACPGRRSLENLVICPYFSVSRFDQKIHTTPVPLNLGDGQFSLLIVLNGEGEISWLYPGSRYGCTLRFRKGECWYVPPGASDSHSHFLKGNVVLLWASVPDMNDSDEKRP